MAKKSKKSKSTEEEAPAAASTGPVLLKKSDHDPLVTLSFHLMSWSYMDFLYTCPTNTHLFSIRRVLEERHGRIKDLSICLGVYSQEREMRGEMESLEFYFDKMGVDAPVFFGDKFNARIKDHSNSLDIDEPLNYENNDGGDGGDGDVKKKKKKKEVLHIYYDFKPMDCENPNPILLDWNC